MEYCASMHAYARAYVCAYARAHACVRTPCMRTCVLCRCTYAQETRAYARAYECIRTRYFPYEPNRHGLILKPEYGVRKWYGLTSILKYGYGSEPVAVLWSMVRICTRSRTPEYGTDPAPDNGGMSCDLELIFIPTASCNCLTPERSKSLSRIGGGWQI